ncbi:MAG TPA: hypothetical protein VM824_07615, partial [Thermoleophilaceae bacterium]|nr:hypothetical protein [Thermoleophilaceae bacterium]
MTVVATIQQVDAGVLNVGYAEAGPSDGRAVLLLHGWPYDIHAYDEVASLLAAEVRDDRPVALRGQQGGHFVVGVDVVRPAVQEKHRPAVARARLGVAHVQ